MIKESIKQFCIIASMLMTAYGLVNFIRYPIDYQIHPTLPIQVIQTLMIGFSYSYIIWGLFFGVLTWRYGWKSLFPIGLAYSFFQLISSPLYTAQVWYEIWIAWFILFSLIMYLLKTSFNTKHLFIPFIVILAFASIDQVTIIVQQLGIQSTVSWIQYQQIALESILTYFIYNNVTLNDKSINWKGIFNVQSK